MSDGGARCLVARGDEQHEERRQLLFGKFFGFDLGVHERARDVVDRVVDAVLAELVHDARQRRSRFEDGEYLISLGGYDVGVTHGQYDVRRMTHRGVVALGDPHHGADDLEGKGHGDVLDEVAGSRFHRARRPSRRRRDQSTSSIARTLRGVEGVGHDAAQARVLGIIGGDHAREVLDHLGGQVHRRDRAGTREEHLGTARDLGDVAVTHEGEVPVTGWKFDHAARAARSRRASTRVFRDAAWRTPRRAGSGEASRTPYPRD